MTFEQGNFSFWWILYREKSSARICTRKFPVQTRKKNTVSGSSPAKRVSGCSARGGPRAPPTGTAAPATPSAVTITRLRKQNLILCSTPDEKRDVLIIIITSIIYAPQRAKKMDLYRSHVHKCSVSTGPAPCNDRIVSLPPFAPRPRVLSFVGDTDRRSI